MNNRRDMNKRGNIPNPNEQMPNINQQRMQQRGTSSHSCQGQPMQQRPIQQSPIQQQRPVQPQVCPYASQVLDAPPKKRKKSKLVPLICLILVVILLAGGGGFAYSYFIIGGQAQEVVEEETGRYALENLASQVKGYDSEKLAQMVSGSYLAQEWKFANNNETIQKWIKCVTSYVKFDYPEVQLRNKRGELMVTDTGERQMGTSDMNDSSEEVKVTHVDFSALASTVQEDQLLIQQAYKASGYKPTDYDYLNEMRSLFLDYLLSKANLPTKVTEIEIPREATSEDSTNAKGESIKLNRYKITSDANLDDLIFGSEEWRLLIDTYATTATGTPFDEKYVKESIITYTWCGANYAQNVYDGESSKVAPIGDGTKEKPAGIGTPIITKAKCLDGKFHDVRVTLVGYWSGQKAIDYAVSFSEKNRGFVDDSVIKLVCFEVKIENLENKAISLDTDMYLADGSANISSRTGNMYGFYSRAIIQPHQKVILNDWATSTELEQKYVCWGKSFARQYPTVWFKLLAGSGEEVPSYDANASVINRGDEGEDATKSEGDAIVATTAPQTVAGYSPNTVNTLPKTPEYAEQGGTRIVTSPQAPTQAITKAVKPTTKAGAKNGK